MISRVMAVALVAAASAVVFQTPASAAIHGTSHPDAIAGSYLVVYKQGRAIDLTKGLKIDRPIRGGFVGSSMTKRQAQRLAAHPDVAFVEQNRVVKLDSAPQAKDVVVEPQESPALPVPGHNTTTYVLDTGIMVNHNSFIKQPIWGTNTVGGPNADCNGHGTHVAGIIGGHFDERLSSWGTQLVAVKVLDCNGSGSLASVVAGVDWVTANRTGPAVANMSLGAIGSPAVDNAVRASIATGITYVIAAGNSALDACHFSPARVSEAITVGAVHGHGRRAWFSNYGSCLDLFSAGVSIRSAWTTAPNATALLSGTSMAAPHITALAANHLSQNLTATPAQVRTFLVSTADGGVIDPGPGSPNLKKISWLAPFPGAPTVSIQCSSDSARLHCDAFTGGATVYSWAVDGHSAGWSEPSLFIGCVPGTMYMVRLVAANSGDAASAVTYVRCSNNLPII